MHRLHASSVECRVMLTLHHYLQGASKREGYFPKGKWYNLFDNTTIDAHEGGRSVTLDLPMGHVGVHMPGGSILPMQQPALVTADVRASALTLLVALPHLEPLEAFADSTAHHIELEMDSKSVEQHHADSESRAHHVSSQSGGGEVQATSGRQAVMSQVSHPRAKCGVSEPGRATACGQIYMDAGDQLQVCPL